MVSQGGGGPTPAQIAEASKIPVPPPGTGEPAGGKPGGENTGLGGTDPRTPVHTPVKPSGPDMPSGPGLPLTSDTVTGQTCWNPMTSRWEACPQAGQGIPLPSRDEMCYNPPARRWERCPQAGSGFKPCWNNRERRWEFCPDPSGGPIARTSPRLQPSGPGHGVGTSQPPPKPPAAPPKPPPGGPLVGPITQGLPGAPPPSCGEPLCRELCTASGGTACTTRQCTKAELQAVSTDGKGNNIDSAKLYKACYDNMFSRCSNPPRTGEWCVGPGADKTCDARAKRVCGLRSSVPERGHTLYARLSFSDSVAWTCGEPTWPWTPLPASIEDR